MRFQLRLDPIFLLRNKFANMSSIVCAGRDRRSQGRSPNPDRRRRKRRTSNSLEFQTQNDQKCKQNETKTIEGTPKCRPKSRYFQDVIFDAKWEAKTRQTRVWQPLFQDAFFNKNEIEMHGTSYENHDAGK